MLRGRPLATDPSSSLHQAVRRSLAAPLLLMVFLGGVIVAQGLRLNATLSAADCARDAVASEREADRMLEARERWLREYLRTRDRAMLDSARQAAAALPFVTASLKRDGRFLPQATAAADELRAVESAVEREWGTVEQAATRPPEAPDASEGGRGGDPNDGDAVLRGIHAHVATRLSALEQVQVARESRAGNFGAMTLGGAAGLALLFGLAMAFHGRRELTSLSRAYAGTLKELEQARDEAERANRLKDEFLATLSHELRTPLNAILGWTTMLRRCPNDSKIVGRATDTIDRNARAQARMVEEILDMSKAVSGKLILNVRPVDLGSTVRAVLAALYPATQAKSVEVRVDLDPGATAWGDPLRVHQILWSLVGNAVKFTPARGRVDVTVRQGNGHVELRVADTGPGIQSEFLPCLFQRFRQEDGSTTRTHGGLGLGLSVVRHLVEMHGGSVRAESPGEAGGATFVLVLPVPPSSGPPPDGHGADARLA